MNKILLINPPGRCLIAPDGGIAERKHCSPPLGLAYLAAGLLKNGYSVEILDMLAEGYEQERYTEQFVYYGLSTSQALERIQQADPDLIGISVLFSNIARQCLNLAALIKENFPDKYILFGGHHPSSIPLRTMENPAVDFVLTGEADDTVVQLCDCLKGRFDLDSVKGLFYRKNGKIVDTMSSITPVVQGRDFKYYRAAKGPNPGRLDALPYPAWDIFPMEKYFSAEVRQGGTDVRRERYAVMVSTRGCAHSCYYCTSPLMGGYKGFRRRTVECVIDEIKWLRRKYGVEEIQFLDDNFFISKSHAKKLCRALAREFPDMLFSVPSGAEVNMLDGEIIDLLAEANFYHMTLALESGNQEIQDSLINKRVDLSRAPEVIARLKKVGMEVRGFLMIGFPGETRESILHTADYALSLDLDGFALSIVTPLPGTPLYDECVENNLLYEEFEPDDIRYSISAIKNEFMDAREIEQVRRQTWLEHQKLKERNTAGEAKRHYRDAGDYALAGFSEKEPIGGVFDSSNDQGLDYADAM